MEAEETSSRPPSFNLRCLYCNDLGAFNHPGAQATRQSARGLVVTKLLQGPPRAAGPHPWGLGSPCSRLREGFGRTAAVSDRLRGFLPDVSLAFSCPQFQWLLLEPGERTACVFQALESSVRLLQG